MMENGSRLWKNIHMKAVSINSDNSLEEFEEFMISVKRELTCDECKRNYEHELSDMMSNMPNRYVSYETTLVVFKLTVDLHNSVNVRLNKQILDYRDALQLYDNNGNLLRRIDMNNTQKLFNTSHNDGFTRSNRMGNNFNSYRSISTMRKSSKRRLPRPVKSGCNCGNKN